MSSRGPPPLKRGPPVRNGGPPPKRSAPSGPMSRGKCERILLVFISSSEKRRAGSVDFSRLYRLSFMIQLPCKYPDGLCVFQGYLVINEPVCHYFLSAPMSRDRDPYGPPPPRRDSMMSRRDDYPSPRDDHYNSKDR